MADAVFRTAQPTKAESAAKTMKRGPADSKVGSTTTAVAPYLDYEKDSSYPHAVDYFELGDTWDDPSGGFPKEVGIIEGYFKDRIESGDMANSTKAVKSELKSILKLTNMSKEERNLVKIETVAAYIKFLSEKEDIKRNIRRYAGAK